MSIQDTLRHYMHVIRQSLILLLTGMLISGGITLAIGLRLPPAYQARALIRVSGTTTTTSGTTNNDVFSAQAQAVSYALLVTGPDTLQKAAQQLPGMTTEQLQHMVSASPLDNTQIIEIRAQAANPQQAMLVANTIATVFITLQIDKESSQLQQTADALSQTLAQTKLQIVNAQQQLTILQNNNATTEQTAHQQSLLDDYQSNYTTLLSNYNQLQTQQVQARTLLSVAQNATAPSAPSGSPIWLNTALACILGLLLMILLILACDWFDVTIQTEQDVEHLAGLAALGCIPHSKQPARLLDFTREEYDTAREAYALLGTAFLALRQDVHTILVTALHPGAGTSTTALYLATTLVQAGKRVLLVDANMRRPTLHTAFGQNNTAGLTNAVQDIALCQQRPDTLPKIWLNQWKTHLPGLWFLPVGPAPAHPAMTPHQQALHTLQDLFTENNDSEGQTMPPLIDFIIFDAPPLEEGAYTQSLAATTDAALLVIEAGKERREILQRAQTLLQRQGTRLLGIIVNQQHKWHRSYFYHNAHRAPLRVSSVQKSIRLQHIQTLHPQNTSKQPLLKNQPLSLPAPTLSTADVHTRQIPIISPADRDIRLHSKEREALAPRGAFLNAYGYETETPAPLFITHAEQNLVQPDTLISFGDGHPRLQFAPRLRLNSTGGIVKQPGIDESPGQ